MHAAINQLTITLDNLRTKIATRQSYMADVAAQLKADQQAFEEISETLEALQFAEKAPEGVEETLGMQDAMWAGLKAGLAQEKAQREEVAGRAQEEGGLQTSMREGLEKALAQKLERYTREELHPKACPGSWEEAIHSERTLAALLRLEEKEACGAGVGAADDTMDELMKFLGRNGEGDYRVDTWALHAPGGCMVTVITTAGDPLEEGLELSQSSTFIPGVILIRAKTKSGYALAPF